MSESTSENELKPCPFCGTNYQHNRKPRSLRLSALMQLLGFLL